MILCMELYEQKLHDNDWRVIEGSDDEGDVESEAICTLFAFVVLVFWQILITFHRVRREKDLVAYGVRLGSQPKYSR